MRTERHDEANSHFSHFYEDAKKHNRTVSNTLSIPPPYKAFYPFIIYTFRPISALSIRRCGYIYHKLST